MLMKQNKGENQMKYKAYLQNGSSFTFTTDNYVDACEYANHKADRWGSFLSSVEKINQ